MMTENRRMKQIPFVNSVKNFYCGVAREEQSMQTHVFSNV